MSTRFKDAFGFIPRGGSALAVFIVIILIAFLAGMLMNRGGDSIIEGVTTTEQPGGTQERAVAELWTCSMHPEIKLPNPGNCPICFMKLIPIETEGAGEEPGERRLKMSNTAQKLAEIQTAPVKREFAGVEIRMAGTIAYDETRLAYIAAWVPGRLDRLHANYTGMRVNKGDKLVQMYSPLLLSAQEELIQAKQAIGALSSSGSEELKRTAIETLEAAREKLKLYGLTESQVRDVESSGRTSTHITIQAPVGGVVVHLDAREGMYVDTGTRICTIADLSGLWILLDAYQSDLPWLRKGQEVEFTSLAFPGERFAGEIAFIDPVLNAETRTAKVRALVDNRDGRLKPDMFITGIVRSYIDADGAVIDASAFGKAEPPLVIPASAPLVTGSRAVAYVRLPGAAEPVFEGREIELGPRAGDYYVVKSGLAEDELVVINGAFKIDSELQILARPSMMNPEGGASGAIHQHDHGAAKSLKRGMSDVKEEHEGHGKQIQESPAYEGHGKQTKESSGHEDHSTGESATGDEALKALVPLYKIYFEVQMALAGDSHHDAVEANRKLLNELKQVDMNIFHGDAHAKWMKLSTGIGEFASKGATAGDIAESRRAFFDLSRAFIELHDTFGHGGDDNYFLTFCSMTNKGKGAFWLQPVDTVYNSFYGASMLRCGSIEKKLPPRKTGGK